tara:strand:- start:857 stop:1039 length:183 start_codon:yes stop_codon:yes gene_type:complete
MEEEVEICSLCEGEIEQQFIPGTKKVFWSKGHNAAPLSEGRCCGSCNAQKVIPARISGLG